MTNQWRGRQSVSTIFYRLKWIWSKVIENVPYPWREAGMFKDVTLTYQGDQKCSVETISHLPRWKVTDHRRYRWTGRKNPSCEYDSPFLWCDWGVMCSRRRLRRHRFASFQWRSEWSCKFFRGTIADNVRFGNVCFMKWLNMHLVWPSQLFVTKEVTYYGIEQNGRNLSGGKQRMTIARAIAKQAPIWFRWYASRRHCDFMTDGMREAITNQTPLRPTTFIVSQRAALGCSMQTS